jgi:hypothetical protein
MRGFLAGLFGSKSSEETAINAVAEVKSAQKSAKTALASHVEVEGLKIALKERGTREAVKSALTIDALLV